MYRLFFCSFQLNTFLFLSAAMMTGCGSSSGSGDGNSEVSEPNDPFDGALGGFTASCATAVKCCAQCFEYYGDPLTPELENQFKYTEFDGEGCGDYTRPCTRVGAIGTCAYSDEAVGGVYGGRTIVDVRYEVNGDGLVYATAGEAEKICLESLNGVWEPL